MLGYLGTPARRPPFAPEGPPPPISPTGPKRLGAGLAQGFSIRLFAFGSPLFILTLCGSKCVLVVSTEPPDDLSCLTTPGVGRPGDGAVARAIDQGHPGAHSESMWGFADCSTDLCAPGCASAG